MKHGHKLVTDGTDNHLVLWILRDEVRAALAAALQPATSACVRCSSCPGQCGLQQSRFAGHAAPMGWIAVRQL